MITTIIGFLISSLLSLSSPEMNSLFSETKLIEITLKPAGTSLMTDMIQVAIDRCADSGGGIVHFTEGEYYSGTIQLRNNTTLNLRKNAVIKGSTRYQDYKSDAFFFGRDLTNIAITGKGIIDGVDCYNPKG
jgi:polygalacturonase